MSYPHMPSNVVAKSTLLRSEEMTLLQLYIPSELSHATVSELGELGKVEFRDLNADQSAFQRTFVSEIKRLEEMSRRIRFLKTQCGQSDIKIRSFAESAADINSSRVRSVQEMDELEAHLIELESKILQMNSSYETLHRKYLELTEMEHVLRETAFFFEEAESRADLDAANDVTRSQDTDAPLLDGADEESIVHAHARDGVHLSFVAGIIPRSRMIVFERVLWRALRGNLYINYSEIEEAVKDPISGETASKNVFAVFAHGQEVIAKITKIAEGMGATIYPIDSSPMKRSEDMLEVAARIEDLNHVLFNTQATRKAELTKISLNVDQWDIMAKKEKGVYHTMNKFNQDSARKALIAEGWCPTNSISAVQYALHAVSERSGSMVPPLLSEIPTTLTPPTYHKTNKFTSAFQTIVDAYGMANYREVNPGLFTIITFPFLFGVMFGDWGHGMIMTAIALYMIYNERNLTKPGQGEIMTTFVGGRYIILLMGIFAIYVGMIYNDIFSLPVYFARSAYGPALDGDHYQKDPDYTYPFGLDPHLRHAENSLLFLNSYKMKMSVVIGVIHMTFGICLSFFNHRFFKEDLNIYTDFIPQLIFLQSTFGYLTVLIIAKWLTHYENRDDGPRPLLQILIFMFLSPGNVNEDLSMYSGQSQVQLFLLILAGICVPWMLFAKPYILYQRHKKNIVEAGYRVVAADGNASPSLASHNSDVSEAHNAEMHGEKFDLGALMTHQVIHTIEFCLGAVSNTASYLRLWALSLAHSQLSEVLWEMTFKITLGLGPIGIVIGFYFWFVLSVGILIVMEGLSAFLHALRLHWVEFNSKFYGGTGVAFQPFSFKHVVEGDEDS